MPSVLHWGLTLKWLSGVQALGPQVVPGAAGWQLPAGLAQVWHVGHEALPQQVLFTQLLDWQSAAAWQLDPLGRFTGGPQAIDAQTLPVEQSVVLAQLSRQLPLRQT
jgi:hypothetical protein